MNRRDNYMSKLSSYFKIYGVLTLIISLCICCFTYYKYRDLKHSNYSTLRVEFSGFKVIPQGFEFQAHGKTLVLQNKYIGEFEIAKFLENKTAGIIEFIVRDIEGAEGDVRSLTLDGSNIINHADVLRIDQGEVDVFIFISWLSLIVSFLWLPLYKLLMWIETRKIDNEKKDIHN